ncbi:MAG: hypothetical protein KKA84_04750 [Bacteroidetes bacterium]|nr:hypothetical protein [Bacteroidota bacterium]
MPLKKPFDLPKIPKTRKKKAEAAIAAIPQKKPDKLEYYCKAFFTYDQALHQQFVVFRVETAVEFTSFAYEVSTEVLREKDQLFIILMGLKAETNIVPGIQTAKKDIILEELVGEFVINIVKQDGSINSGRYKLNIYNKEIELLEEFIPEKKNNRHFCDFSVDEELNEFPEE